MSKHYRYTLRKTTLGLGSVAVAMFLAGQADTAKAAEEGTGNKEELTQEEKN